MFSIYLIEIKNRLILILTCWLFLFFVSYLNKEIVLYLTVKPNINLNEKFYFIATNAFEILNSYLNLSYFVSLQFTIYAISFHFISFVSPGLYNFELTKIYNLSRLSFFIWLLGNYIFNQITLPICWNFFVDFQSISAYSVNIFLELKVENYLAMYYNIYYINTFLFQGVLILFIFLEKIPELTKFVKKTRKVSYFLFIIIATFLTPPDIFSQIMVFLFLMIIYEIVIIIIFLKNFD